MIKIRVAVVSWRF